MIQEVLNNQSVDIVAMQEHAIATLACKASVKGNTYLTTQDMQTIIDNLMRCDNPMSVLMVDQPSYSIVIMN